MSSILRGKFTHRPRNDPKMYDGPYPFIQTGDVARAQKYIREHTQTLNDQGLAVSKQFPPGTLVMTIAANVGDVAILNFAACFPDSIVGFVPSNDLLQEFGYWLFSAMKAEFMSTATLGTQLNLNVDRIAAIPAPLPPRREQRAIVVFLNRETEKIDRLAEVRQQQIGVLREERFAVIHHSVTLGLEPDTAYRDSGNSWLLQIPAHWHIAPLWSVASVRFSNVDKKIIAGQSPVLLCNYVDVYKNDFVTNAMQFMSASAPSTQIRVFQLNIGDVLITKDSEDWRDIAVPALVSETKDNLLCGYHLAMLRPRTTIYPAYLFRYLQCAAVRHYFSIEAAGVTRYGISGDSIKRCPCLIPPIKEQQAIVAHIDRETAKIDALIDKYERELELLAEYRAALISHVVTGKVDVRGLVDSEPAAAAI